MKTLERIFLYSVLAILVFYVFLVDNKVESQVAIQEEIRAKRIVIVNDTGRPVVWLFAGKDGGGIGILNKDGTLVAGMGTSEYGGSMEIYNKDGTSVAGMVADENGGSMLIGNKDGTSVAGVQVNVDGNGEIGVFNKSGKGIGSLP